VTTLVSFSAVQRKKTIFDRASRGQYFYTGNVSIDDMKLNRINSTATEGYGIASGCTLPPISNLQIYHQEQNGSGVIILNTTSAGTDLTIQDSQFDFNTKDITANKDGRGVQLVNTVWDRLYGFNWTGSWSGTTNIKESYGYLPSIIDTASAAVNNTQLKLVDRYGDITLLLYTNASGTIEEQNVPTWQVQKDPSETETVSSFNPFILQAKKYGKTFISEPKTFSVRTVETKQLSANPFTTLNESSTAAWFHLH
jgi:hypothetical protein